MPRIKRRPDEEADEGSELSVMSRHDEVEQPDISTPVTREEFKTSYKDALKEMAIAGFPIAFIRLVAAFGDSWWWTLFTENQTLFPVASLITVIQMVILNFFPSTLYATSNVLSQRLEEFGTSGHHAEVQIREE